MFFFTGVYSVFPNGLLSFGLNEALLTEVFDQVENDKSPSWCLREVPDYGFYQDMHHFLKKWPRTHKSSKTLIGKFYSTIDINLKSKQLRPDNAYRFIDRLVSSKHPRTSVVKYGLDLHVDETALQIKVKECMKYTESLKSDLDEMMRQ